MKLVRQDREVVNYLKWQGSDGATPEQIRTWLDAVPEFPNRPRKDGRVYHRTPTVVIARIRKVLGKKAVRTIIEDGVTRYYAGEINGLGL